MPGQKRGARLRSGCAGHHYSFRHSGARVKRANPESRDSGSGPLDHDGVEGRRELSAETCLSWPSTFGWYRERLTLPWRGRVDSHERSEMGAGWGDALTRKWFEKTGRSPHPGPYLASLDDGPTLPLQGRVKRSSAANLACPGHLHSGGTAKDLPSPGGGGSTPMSEAKWESGWGDALTRKWFEKTGRSPHPGPYLASLDDGPTLPLQGRVKRSSAANLACPGHLHSGGTAKDLPSPGGGGSTPMSEAKWESGWGDALTRKLFEKAGGSPHPGPYLASLDDGPTLPLQGRVKRSSAPKLASQHLFEDLAADGLVGQRAITPPPAVALHLSGGRDKALLHFRKIGIAEVQAEDQPPRSDPAQRQALGAEVILEHPVVTGRLGILHRPDRGEVGDPNRQISAREAIVQLLGAAIPSRIQPVIDAAEVGAGEMRQEFVHRRHDVRVRVERAAGKADVGGMIVAEAAHQPLLPAHHSDRQSAGEALAVSHHVGTDAEIFLRAAGSDAKADKNFIENQNDAALVADLAQPLQPRRIGFAVEMRAARRIDQRRIARRIGVGVQRLQRIHQHAGDVAPRPQDVKRLLRHFGERIGLVRRDRIADARLHVAPPSVIGAGESDEMGPLGVVAGEPHRLHHGFRAGHVEGDFIKPGNLGKTPRIFGNHGMVAAEHRPERVGALFTLDDTLLVKIVAENVDAVGAGQIVEQIAVDVGDGDAGGGLHERAGRQIFLDEPTVLKGHTVGAGELQVGDVPGGLGRQRAALGIKLGIKLSERKEGLSASGGDFVRRAIAAEIFAIGKFVKRDQPRHPARHFRMPSQRAVLGARQCQPRRELREDSGAGHRRGGERENRERRIHARSASWSI